MVRVGDQNRTEEPSGQGAHPPEAQRVRNASNHTGRRLIHPPAAIPTSPGAVHNPSSLDATGTANSAAPSSHSPHYPQTSSSTSTLPWHRTAGLWGTHVRGKSPLRTFPSIG